MPDHPSSTAAASLDDHGSDLEPRPHAGPLRSIPTEPLGARRTFTAASPLIRGQRIQHEEEAEMSRNSKRGQGGQVAEVVELQPGIAEQAPVDQSEAPSVAQP